MEGSEGCLLPKPLVHEESKVIEGADGPCDIGARPGPLLHDELVPRALAGERSLHLVVVSDPDVNPRPVAHDVGVKGPSEQHCMIRHDTCR